MPAMEQKRRFLLYPCDRDTKVFRFIELSKGLATDAGENALNVLQRKPLAVNLIEAGRWFIRGQELYGPHTVAPSLAQKIKRLRRGGFEPPPQPFAERPRVRKKVVKESFDPFATVGL